MAGETGLFQTDKLKQQLEKVDISTLFKQGGVLAPTIPMHVLIRGMLDEMRLTPDWGVKDFSYFQKRIDGVFGQTNSSQVAEVNKIIVRIFECWDVAPAKKDALLHAAHQPKETVYQTALRSPASGSYLHIQRK